MQGIGTGILIAIILIGVIEIFGFFRRSTNLSREIDELRKKVRNIEEQFNNQSK